MRLLKEKKIIDSTYNVDIFSIVFSSGFFVGYIPFASGTFGSLFALLFFFIPGFSEVLVLSITIILVFIVSIFTLEKMVKRYGDDPSVVVVDEIIGMWITILLLKICLPGNLAITPTALTLGFLLFRFFDITKLFPANYFDKLKSGFGIIMDDIISGLYAGIISSLIVFLIKKYF